MNEATLDLYINSLLREAGIDAEYQDTDSIELKDALKTASKSQTGEQGRPDYLAVVEGYVLVIEDKKDRDKLCLYDDDGTISQTPKAARDYAVNGAVWYAKKILEHGAYRKIFAFGSAGDPKHHTIKPVFVGEGVIKELDEVETFANFSPKNIEGYYNRVVREEIPPEAIQRDDILRKARILHNHLRNYGNLGDKEKPLVVSAILLALREKDYGFSLDSMTGDYNDTDGAKLYRQLVNSINRANVRPEVKRDRVLNQFTLIKDSPILNAVRDDLKKTPLKFFAEYLDREIFSAIELNNSPKDYLGMFYGEFVRYSGGDGQTLGVVLTPPHITELFCDLVDLKPDDVIFDPCCGTGGFLIAGMHRMLNAAKNETERKHIKEKQIFGLEIRNDMFAIATTNMILRGDGQSNLTCEDFFARNPRDLQLNGITVGFMNPPYSQARNKATQNLSELNFIYQLLESMLKGGRAAVIVPVSTMIGKTKEDRQRKADILKHHTLEGVISLSKDTFYNIGTVPCIAVFTAGEPHPKEKLAKFISFEDDGWEIKKHIGLVDTERAKDRKQYLIDCWRGERSDYPSKFMVQTAVEAGDEWLHSFYYYNDEVSDEKDFAGSVADYLTFEFGAIVHGRGYLFEPTAPLAGEGESSALGGSSLEGVKWGEFLISDIAKIVSGRGIFDNERFAGDTPYIGASAVNNGITHFVGNTNTTLEADCLSVNSNGSVGYAFYHPYEALYSGDCRKLRLNIRNNRHIALFVARQITAQKDKYNYGYKMGTARLQRQRILLPVDDKGLPDYAFMERFMRRHEQRLIREYVERVSPRLRKAPPPVADLAEVRWGSFRIGDLFNLEAGKGKGANHLESDPEGISYLGATNRNNAVLDFVKPVPELIQKGNCIAFIRNGEGSMGYSVYKAEDFIATSDITAGYAPFLNRYTGIFIATVADKVRGKYSFNYKRSDTRLKREIIRLPVDDSGNPDYAFMEGYIRLIEYRQLQEAVRHFTGRM